MRPLSVFFPPPSYVFEPEKVFEPDLPPSQVFEPDLSLENKESLRDNEKDAWIFYSGFKIKITGI